MKIWPEGKSYQGHWQKGKMHGNGELVITENERVQKATQYLKEDNALKFGNVMNSLLVFSLL